MIEQDSRVQDALEVNKEKSLAVAQSRSLVVDADPDFDPSLFQGVDAADILIPKLLLMQGTSKLVEKELAAKGDIINSVTQKVMVTKDVPLEIIPLMMFKNIDVSTKGPLDKKLVYQETLPFTGENALLPREEILGDQMIVRMHAINVFCMLRSEILNPEALPYVIKFKSSSYKTGKALTNHFSVCAKLRKNPYSKSIILGVDKETDGDNIWFVFTVKDGQSFDRVKDAEILAACKSWASTTAQAANIRVDNSDETGTL